MWKPTIDTMGDNPYPLFEHLVDKMRGALMRSRRGPALYRDGPPPVRKLPGEL
jgi:hypothetical protein